MAKETGNGKERRTARKRGRDMVKERRGKSTRKRLRRGKIKDKMRIER